MIYLDYNATTPLDPQVAAAMTDVMTRCYGNPSSNHAAGRASRQAIDSARAEVARFLGAAPAEVVFTSGGTEANNHALMGAAWARRDSGRHILISSVEHPAVTEVCRHLATRGFEFSTLPVDHHGRVRPEQAAAAMRDDTSIVSVMLANNEVGTLQPIAELAALAREKGALMHTDAAQAVGKIPVDFHALGVDLLSVAGHKFYGPKGVGALLIRDGVSLENLMHGAGHEGGRRPGTENILEIVGLGAACRLAREDLATEAEKLRGLRDQLQTELLAAFPAAVVHGHPQQRLPNTLSISFPGLVADAIMAAMPDVAVSAGAACHGGGPVASRVLQAMGVDNELALGTLRISLGRMTTEEEVREGAAAIGTAIRTVQQRRGL